MKLFLVVVSLLSIAFANKVGDCDNIDVQNILSHLRVLDDIAAGNGGNRAAGTSGYQVSVGFIVSRLMNTNFKVSIQDFTFNSFRVIGIPGLVQTQPIQKTFTYQTEFRVMSNSGSGTLSALATGIPNLGCNAADYANFPAGNIAIILRGECPFLDKARLAEAAGAVAVIFYNNNQGGAFSANCESNLPVFGVPYYLGLALSDGINVRLSLNVETRKEVSVTSNVIAETLTGDPNNVVLIGSHLDGVPAGPGINDNGSGTATNLELALTTFQCIPNPKNKIRFAWWGGEELGLLGSYHYVDDLVNNDPAELRRIALNINIDMLGSPNFFYGIYNGSGAAPEIRDKCVLIQREFEQFLSSKSEPYLLTPFDGRSDYGPFIEVGIPAGGLFSGAEVEKNSTGRATFGGLANTAYDPCYHAYCDSFDNISEESIGTLASATYHTLVRLATSTELIQQISANKKLATGRPYIYKTHPDAISRY